MNANEPGATRKLPAGLAFCDKCGEPRGFKRDHGERLEVKCICEGIPCPKCKTNKIHRPISNYYDIETGKIWHVSHYGYMNTCDRCKRRKRGSGGKASVDQPEN